MRTVRLLALAGSAVLVAAGIPATALGAASEALRVRDVAFEVERTPRAQATFQACAQAVETLAHRGWRPGDIRVRIRDDPFDATAASADVALGTAAPPEDSAFELVTAIVGRRLLNPVGPGVAGVLARTVAAHLTSSSCARRAQWEASWLARLRQGDVLTTALPEALWRAGADAAIRAAADPDWPASAYATLAAGGSDNALDTVGEVAVAGLVDPMRLGFHTGPAESAPPAPSVDATAVTFAEPGVRVMAMPVDASAVGVQVIRNERTAAWVAVKYAFTGSFDAVPLSPVGEVMVPLRGTAWSGIVVVALDADARFSVSERAVGAYPVRVRSWDFLAGDGRANLAWETQGHEGLRGFVVEALESAGDGMLAVRRRTLVPVAEDGENPFGYAFVDENTEGVAAYRLLALSADGFLSEVGMFPLRDKP